MSYIPEFFVPGAPEGQTEEAFSKFSKFASGSAPTNGKRIYSIEFKSDGETWVATVGQFLNQ